MAVKKTVKKRRTRKKTKTLMIETIIDALNDNAELSPVNKRTIVRLKKSASEVEKQQILVVTSEGRVDKARVAVASAKTPAVKEKARIRLEVAKARLKDVKTNLSTAITDQKKAQRLAKGLYKTMESVRLKMIKEYDKSARLQEKTIDKPLRRRRMSKKKVIQTTPDQP